MMEYAKIYKQKGINYICDPGQSLTAWNNDNLREWINGSYMLITNDYELELVMKMTGMDKKGLLGMTKTIITTLGEKGSLISSSDGDMQIPVAKISGILDPTGAGDAYRAGLIKGLVTGKDMATSAKMGAVASAYAIEKYGTQEHCFSYNDFAERYRSNFGELR